ncbi:MAG: NAD-dependent epimerase/dehydratase family protein [Desulfosalsimonadaceae bacterium]
MPVKKEMKNPEKFAADVLVAGATGLIGGAVIRLLYDDPSAGNVIALTRRKIPSLPEVARMRQEVMDFDRLEASGRQISARTVVCALGTTIKKAGSQETFREVDYGLPMRLAEIAVKNGCEKFILISAVGADPNSPVFYNKVKGELERDLEKIGFKTLHIIRPSLLLGDREEFRLGEEIGKMMVKPFQFLIPGKYKPVHAGVIAQKIRSLLDDDTLGVHVYEGGQIT